jgi:Tol biopolymer transport system component
MEDLQVKVGKSKVYVNYTSIFDAEESFYEEFNLMEYRQKLNDFEKGHKFEINGNNGKLIFSHNGKDIYVTLSRDGRETKFAEKDLLDKFFI